jgi:hypothetical protein
MEKFREHVLPFLTDGYIRYSTPDQGPQTISADHFRKSFSRIAATELPHIGLRSLYYRSLEHPGLVMRFRVSGSTYSATLAPRSEFGQQLEGMGVL